MYNARMMKKWKTLATIKLLTHPRLNVYEDEVELPNGHKTQYIHFGKQKDAACVIATNGEGLILVQKEYSYPPNEWLYQFPGGALDGDETPVEGGLRELAEEAGYSGKLHPLGWFYLDNRRRQDKLHIFTCTELEPRHAKQDIEEEFITYWLSESEIDELISNGEIVNYSMLAAWALYKSNVAGKTSQP